MPLVRLLAIALLLSPMWSFAQSAPASTDPGTTSPSKLLVIAPEGSYFWQLAPNQDANDKSSLALEKSAKQQLLIVKPPVDKGILVAEDTPLLGGAVCLSIRSYVFARDSKDSDSTHLVRSSTCVPAAKYKVKVVEQPNSVIYR